MYNDITNHVYYKKIDKLAPFKDFDLYVLFISYLVETGRLKSYKDEYGDYVHANDLFMKFQNSVFPSLSILSYTHTFDMLEFCEVYNECSNINFVDNHIDKYEKWKRNKEKRFDSIGSVYYKTFICMNDEENLIELRQFVLSYFYKYDENLVFKLIDLLKELKVREITFMLDKRVTIPNGLNKYITQVFTNYTYILFKNRREDISDSTFVRFLNTDGHRAIKSVYNVCTSCHKLFYSSSNYIRTLCQDCYRRTRSD